MTTPEDIYEPCPCGSGKKYKFCCYQKNREAAKVADYEWVRIRRTEGELIEKCLLFAKASLGPTVALSAWYDFHFGEAPPAEDSPDFEATFLPWLVFNWIPSGKSRTIAEDYRDKNELTLDPYHKTFISTIIERPYSFYLVEGARPGVSLSLKDLLVPEDFTVKERQASATLKRGDIIYSRVLPMDGQAIMVGTSPYAFPPEYHYGILDLRDALTKKGTTLDLACLHKHASEIRRVYIEFANRHMNPELPKFVNTDGDPLLWAEARYELKCSPEDAFHALKSLSLEPEEHILDDGRFDNKRELRSVEFDWMKKGNRVNKGWDNTVLGHIRIDGTSLTAQINSEKRASTIQDEIKKRLGDKATFKTTVIDSVEHRLKDKPIRSSKDEALSEQQAMMAHPEVQAQLKKMMEAHWEKWFDEPIPALKGKTPRQAAKTQEGRERLEALLLEYERKDYGDEAKENLLRPDISLLRKELGLLAVKTKGNPD